MPGDFRCLRCEYPCAYFTTPSAHGAAGALGTRHSPRPLFAKGERFLANLGRDAWAETAKASLDTTSLRGALATKQSSFGFAARWIASLALAITAFQLKWLFEIEIMFRARPAAS